MAFNPLLPIAAGAGALLFFLTSKKSDAAPPEGQGAPPGSTKPPVSTPATIRPTSELSAAQRDRMAQALGRLGVSPATGKLSGAADADAIRFASQVVGELDAAGFKDAASALRAYVDEASKAVKTPVEAAPIAQAAAAAGMTAEQAAYAARLLALERDPNKIALFIDWLKKLSPSPQRDTFIQMAQALALQLAAANVTTDTLDQISQVIESSPEEPDEDEEPLVVSPKPVYTATSPGLPTSKPPAPSPAAVRPPPETPHTVPPKPVPQPTPAPLSDAELVARSVATNLGATQQKFGVKSAKGKEDKMLVKKFQALVGLGQDGSAGPATFLMLATKGAVNLPLVYYWPKTATAATVAEYRANLEKIAQTYERNGRRSEANTLRAAAAREHGEGGINGPLYGAPAAAPRPAAPITTAPKPATAPAAVRPVSNVVSIAPGDPTPGARTLKAGDRGPDVLAWQQALVKGYQFGDIHMQWSNPVGRPDGIFGKNTQTATASFQRANSLTADGIVGPNTRAKARAVGMI